MDYFRYGECFGDNAPDDNYQLFSRKEWQIWPLLSGIHKAGFFFQALHELISASTDCRECNRLQRENQTLMKVRQNPGRL